MGRGAIDLTITGAEQLRAVGAALKEAGNEGKALRRGLLREMRSVEREGLAKAQESARENLPHRGGLNEYVASSKFTASNRLTGSGAGTQLKATKPGGRQGTHDLEATDAGQFRHPVFGHEGVWVPQSIAPGWWTNALMGLAPDMQIRLLAVMAAIDELITKG